MIWIVSKNSIPLNMLGEINNLPDQLGFAYQLGSNMITGMEGFSTGGHRRHGRICHRCGLARFVLRSSGPVACFRSSRLRPADVRARPRNASDLLIAFRQHRRNAGCLRKPRAELGAASLPYVQAVNWRNTPRKTISRSGRSNTLVSLVPRWDFPLAYCLPCSNDWDSSPTKGSY